MKKEPFWKVGDSARNDYEKGMPAAHTLFQVKSLALIANARKYYKSLHFLSECHWCELTSADCPDRVDTDAAWSGSVQWSSTSQTAPTLVYVTAALRAIPTSHQRSALRESRRDATLCPDCQDKVSPHDVKPERYGYDRMSTAHLYSVPVLNGFDAVRNSSHRRRDTDDNCKSWREARKSVAVLAQEASHLAKGVSCGTQRVAGWRTSTSFRANQSRTLRRMPLSPEKGHASIIESSPR